MRPPEIESTQRRRRFLQQVGVAGAALAAGGIPTLSRAQAAEPAGTLPNAGVLAAKDPAMKVHSERPLTASMPAEFMDEAVTQSPRVFVRNNLFTTELSAEKHRVSITGLVDRPVELSLSDLRSRFPAFSQVAMLECAGSGRNAFQPVPRGTPWPAASGMSCPRWNGVRLADVLRAAGVRGGDLHVAFTGADFGALPTIPKVARSVPLWKAMEPHSMIAWGMNDEPLPVVHGFPLRTVIPGWAGSASVKWVASIEVMDRPLKGPYMDASYRIPKRPVEPGGRMPPDALSTEGWPVKSIITHPAPNAKFSSGRAVLVSGKAWVAEADIARVDVSFDEGVTWRRADLNAGGDKYAWRTWSYAFTPDAPGYRTVIARATDTNGVVQPIAAAWNPLGYFWNGMHRVGFSVEA